MTSIIKFTAFSGVHDESPPCYLLQVDQFCFLLDCGWDEKFDMNIIENIKKHLHRIDAVLLSHPDVFHLGALAYLVGKLGLKCPVYATIPIYKMGQMFMYDLYQSRHNCEDFSLFTLDDVDAAFDLIIQVKYAQTVQLKGKGHGLTITPHAAGHMVGGTIWKIVKDEEEVIVYAVDYNHKKERHLDGAVLETITRPHILITDAFMAQSVQARRKERDQALLTNILKTLRSNGNILIAVDTAGRVLELSQLLEQLWRNTESGLCAYSIALLNNVSYNVVEFAKSQVEWMSDKIMRMFEESRNNPFQFKHITLCHTLADLANVPDPKAVLVSVPDLECGFSRDLFVQWASNPKNSVVLTCRPSPGCMARHLIDNPKISVVDMIVHRRVYLEGEELEKYRQKEREEKLAKQQAEKDASLVEGNEEEMEVEADTPTSLAPPSASTSSVSKTPKHDLMMEDNKSRKTFFKQTKSYPMYPCKEEKIKWDDYGEPIVPEDYMIKDAVLPEDKEKEPDEPMEEEQVTMPTKCISHKQVINIRSSVSYIDFEGRSDGESIKKIVTMVKPRQLILVHGVTEATNSMLEFCKKSLHLPDSKIFAPHINEVVDATTETHIYQVKLKDSLMSSISFSQAKDAELAWLDGQIHINPAANLGQFSKNENEDTKELNLVPILDALPSAESRSHKRVFINPPRLSDFKQFLTKAGIQAEFCGGVLICNGAVAVRKTENGELSLEGSVCEDYYRIRQLLYNQFAII